MKYCLLFSLLALLLSSCGHKSVGARQSLLPPVIKEQEQTDRASSMSHGCDDLTSFVLLDSLQRQIREWSRLADTAFGERNFLLSDQIKSTLSAVTELANELMESYPEEIENLDYIVSAAQDARFYVDYAVETKQENFFDKCSVTSDECYARAQDIISELQP